MLDTKMMKLNDDENVIDGEEDDEDENERLGIDFWREERVASRPLSQTYKWKWKWVDKNKSITTHELGANGLRVGSHKPALQRIGMSVMSSQMQWVCRFNHLTRPTIFKLSWWVGSSGLTHFEFPP